MTTTENEPQERQQLPLLTVYDDLKARLSKLRPEATNNLKLIAGVVTLAGMVGGWALFAGPGPANPPGPPAQPGSSIVAPAAPAAAGASTDSDPAATPTPVPGGRGRGRGR